ncbi:MAG: tetratricopeptide repeat protein [Gemmatimonadaceae bacterium]
MIRRLIGCAVLVATRIGAQSDPAAGVLTRAMDAENQGRVREAVAAYREAIARGAVIPGVLGLERAFALVAQEDSVLPALDTLLPRFPREAALRTAQLRVLVAVGREREAQRAVAAWRAADPEAIDPDREYARVLLFHGRMAAADTVLADAVRRLGSARGMLLEVAQLRAGLGRWTEAATAWREVMQSEPYYETAAFYAMLPTPVPERDSVRVRWGAATAPLGARQALAQLEVAWGAPRRGWALLASLPVRDTTVAIWEQFAQEVERVEGWGVLTEVVVAIQRARPSTAHALRAARIASRAGADTIALRLAREAQQGPVSERRVAEAVPIELEALARLGRAAEAERVLTAAAPVLGSDVTRRQARTIAMAWIRAGDVERARRAVREAPLDDADAVSGWLALYEGEIGAARTALRQVEALDPLRIEVLALLARTTATRSRTIGEAYLALARGDSTRAVRAFELLATELPELASLALVSAARVQVARGDAGRAAALWTRIIEQHPSTPEAAEAWLEWGRLARRTGDRAAARTRFEQLILLHPTSALVPQARRELDGLAMEERR